MLTFSVIIPTFNRINDLWVCLGSFDKIDYPKDKFEIIIVNDGADRIDRAIYYFREKLNIYLIDCKGLGPARARNKGAIAAKGNYLAFIDDDCTADPQWFNSLEKHLKWFPNSIVGGYTVNGLKENLYSEGSQLIIDYLYSYYNKVNDSAIFVTSNNFAVTRVRFQQVGGFNDNFLIPGGEDRHFCRKWLNYGYKIIYEPKAIVSHWHELNVDTFWEQQFNYGKGAYIFKSVLKEKNEFEPKNFYIEILLYPIKKAPRKKLKLTMIFILAQMAILAGFIYQKLSGQHQKSHEQQPTT